MSQHPLLIESGYGSFLLLIWIVPITRLILLKKIKIDKQISSPILILLLYAIYLFSAEGFTGNAYLIVPSFTNAIKMLVIMLIGYSFASIISLDDFTKLLFWSCLLGGFVISIFVFLYGFSEGIDVFSRAIYGSKNSVSQIIFSCFIFTLFLPAYSKYSIVKYPMLMFMVYMIFILKSRSTILGFVLLLFILIIKSKDKKIKIFAFTFVIASSILLLYSDTLNSIFIDGIMTGGGRDTNDLEDLSSGRTSMFTSAPALIDENLFFGRGRYFIESFPLAALVEVGLCGSLIIFSFLFWVIKKIRTKFSVKRKIDFSLIILFCVYVMNSFFEEQAPFGPGAKSFLFWLPFGFVLYKRTHLYLNFKKQLYSK
ncbi:MAG: O-antigen ligase family protein [Flavobacteriales bacterium]|nr:O-antigen ligase family protein [Flavobacteriales bacterium]